MKRSGDERGPAVEVLKRTIEDDDNSDNSGRRYASLVRLHGASCGVAHVTPDSLLLEWE
ncbi:hypothetical protein PQQ51_19970 [Paraburkholderia xenovorans]|uniref:hypothetical protein n=1 Tax=Paraburkholderia xenovorans TaxID=36873 RepID=UPI0038BBE0F3